MGNQNEMLGIILSRLDKIEKQFAVRTSAPVGEYLTPKEVCETLKISKNKFYSWVEQGYLHPIKPDPKGRKVYVHRAEIVGMFPKEFGQ
jgi:excisionase family DNA binding protein